MTAPVWYIIFGLIMLLIVPIVPKIIALRVSVLHTLRLHALANWHDRNSKVIAVAARIILGALGLVLLYMGFAGQV